MMNIDEIMEQMTTEEKVMLMQAKNSWQLNGVERLGVPEVVLTDGPHGVRYVPEGSQSAHPATAMPAESILSASWDLQLVEEVGRLLGQECREIGVNILLGPSVNGKRSPLGGRNFEYFSEDPFLAGKLAAAYIRGVQSQGVGTSLKHYVCNDQETRRFSADVTVDERTLREIYLKSFEIAIKEGKPWAIMGAYNRLRGQHLCENSYVLREVLRDEYEFDGVVLTDWGACVNKVESHKNGLDLETGSNERAQELLDAIESGEISMEVVDEHVRRILELIGRVIPEGEAEPVDWELHHLAARRAASESMVLLKNEDGILPLEKGSDIAVIGRYAAQPHFAGGGSAGNLPYKVDSPLDALKGYADVTYVKGYEQGEPDEKLVAESCRAAAGKQAVVIFAGMLEANESEGSDKTQMAMPQSMQELIYRVADVNPNVILVNASGSPIELYPVEEDVKAILHAGLTGQGQGQAVADILFGEANPCGKLAETFPVRLEQNPTYPYFPGYNDEVVYHEGLMVGYRYYDTKKIPVQYPFGFGLSYTTFEYSNPGLSAEQLGVQDEQLIITVDVTNTGDRAGKEIVQLYVKDEKSYLVRPEKELKAFEKAALAPGETKTLTFTLERDAFSYYVPHLSRYAVEEGWFVLLVGASSTDIRQTASVYVASVDEVRLPLGPSNTMLELYSDNRYHDIIKAFYETMGMDENNPMFPIFGSIVLNSLPGLLTFYQIPIEEGTRIMNGIIAQIEERSNGLQEQFLK